MSLIDLHTLCGISAGTLCIILYVIKTRPPLLADGITVFLAGYAVIVGIRVCAIAIDASVLSTPEVERPYVFLGGIALIWVSIAAIIEKVKRQSDNRHLPKRPS